MLGNIEKLPSLAEIDAIQSNMLVKEVLDATIGDDQNRACELHELARQMLSSGLVDDALKVLLFSSSF